MVKSTPLPNGSVVIKAGRKGASTALFLVLILSLLAAGLALLLSGIFAPTSLAMAQEQALGLLHGGIAARKSHTFVDGCLQVEGAEGPQAITRTRRDIVFHDGTSLSVIFSASPAPTNMACP